MNIVLLGGGHLFLTFLFLLELFTLAEKGRGERYITELFYRLNYAAATSTATTTSG